MLATLVASPFTEVLGRRRTLILGNFVQAIGWTIMYLAGSFGPLLGGRIVHAVGIGLANPTAYVFLSEVATIKYARIRVFFYRQLRS